MKAIYKLSLAVLAGAALGAVAVQGLRAQAKPPVYVVAEIEVTDPATYQTYVDRNGALVQSFGGRFIARGGKTEAIAGPPPGGAWPSTRSKAWKRCRLGEIQRNTRS